MWFGPNNESPGGPQTGMPWRAIWAAAFGLAALLGGAAAGAQEERPRVMRHAPQFWTIPEQEREDVWQVDFEFVVYYFDPHWHLCWGEGDGFRLYLPVVTGAAPALAAGQRVRLEGSVIPARGLDRARLRVTLLEEDAELVPRQVDGAALADPAHNAAWVELEGVVIGQTETDASHVEYRLAVEGEPAVMRLLLNPTEPVPQLTGQRIRAHGVLVGSFDPAGRWLHSDLWVPRRRDIHVVGVLGDDPRFELPRTPIDHLPGATGDVRIVGTVHARDPEHRLVVRDDTGQLSVRTAQSGVMRIGQQVEIVGRVERADGQVELRAPLVREEAAPTAAAGPAGDVLQKLRLASQVLEMTAEEAARGHPVQLRGVVTWSHPRADFFFLEDASSGVRVELAAPGLSPPALGAGVRVEGRTRMGAYAPEVRADRWLADVSMARPVARRVSLEQVLTGREEARTVALSGYLREVTTEENWTQLELVGAGGEFGAMLPAEFGVGDLRGAVIRVEGVCAARADAQGRMTDFRLWVPDRNAIEVEEPRPADPFATPRVPIVNLLRFNPRGSMLQRVHVAGRVTAQLAGGALFVQDAGGAVEVLTRDRRPVAIGAEVAVAGFAGREGQRPVIREGEWRLLAEPAGAIEPWRIPEAKELVLAADRRLVYLEGRLLDEHARGAETWLTLEAVGDRIFEAYFIGDAQWAVGSRLGLTGLYLLERDEAGRARGFTLRLRNPADVVVLSSPPWWNARRLGALLGALLLGAVGALAWIALLRRQVRRQTAQIRLQMMREAQMQADLERTSRLESLGVLAGGIAHDFNNLLTAILGNLGLIMLDEPAMQTARPLVENARRAARRAGEITNQLLTFAKGGEPIRKAVALPELVRESAEFALHGSAVRAEFAVSPALPAAAADPAQISRVIHNLVLNAAQAMPVGGVVRLELRAVEVGVDEVAKLPAGKYVLLSVSDSGPGIAAAELKRVFEPYYSTKQGNSGLGLAVVRSIVHRHGGHIDVESTPGSGTCFHIWLPTAAGEPAAPEVELAVVAQSGRRVLVMDDEEIIRAVAVEALNQAGHRAEAAADGAEAVRRYRAAREAGQPFDVVVLDLTVPGGMGGEQAARELLKIDPMARLIVSSGYSSNPVMGKFREHGFCAVVPKPYELDCLLRAVEQASASSDGRAPASGVYSR